MTYTQGLDMARSQRRTAFIWAMVALLWGLLLLRTASAQSRPSAPLGDPMRLGQADPSATQPDSSQNGGQADRGGQAGGTDVIGPRDLYKPETPSSPFWGGITDGFPSYEVRAIPVARAQDVFARQSYHRSQHDIEMYYRDARDDFEQSDDYQSATEAVRQAFEALKRAEQSALQPLMSNDTYQAQMQLRDRLSQQIADAKFDAAAADNPAADPVLRAMAASKLGYAEAMRDVEQKLLNDDSAVADARAKLRDAAAAVRKLEASYDRSIRLDPALRQIKSHEEDLRIARLVTAAYLDSLITARNATIDYSYYTRGIGNYSPLYGLGYGLGGLYNGYGGGYGYGGVGFGGGIGGGIGGVGGFGVGTVGFGNGIGGTLIPTNSVNGIRGAGFSSSVGVTPGAVATVPGAIR